MYQQFSGLDIILTFFGFVVEGFVTLVQFLIATRSSLTDQKEVQESIVMSSL